MYGYYAEYDIGFTDGGEHSQEDYVRACKIDTSEGEVLFFVIADGTRSLGLKYHPALLGTIQVEETVKRLCKNNAKEFLETPHLFLQEAMISAGNMFGALQTVDEQNYSGFAASMTCVILYDGKFCFAHAGNTRLHLVRRKKKTQEWEIVQLSVDQTKGMELVNNGEISFYEYHIHPSRLILTGGVGVRNDKIQIFKGVPFNEEHRLLMTTDGIHCAINPNAIKEIMIQSNSGEEAVKSLITAAKMQKNQDNMAAIVIWNSPETEAEK